MFYDEEELLEAVDILMEDYDLTEDEAIDLLMEDYEEYDFDDYELDELSEAVEILMEDYDLTEDDAIDLLMESEENNDLELDPDAVRTLRNIRRGAMATYGLAAAGGLGYEAYKRHKLNKSPIKKAKYKLKKRVEKARRRRRVRRDINKNKKIMKKSIKQFKKDLHLK